MHLKYTEKVLVKRGQSLLIRREIITISRQIEFVILDPQTQITRVIYTPMNLYFKTLQSLIVFLSVIPQLKQSFYQSTLECRHSKFGLRLQTCLQHEVF